MFTLALVEIIIIAQFSSFHLQKKAINFDHLKRFCELESMRPEVMQITFNRRNSIALMRKFLCHVQGSEIYRDVYRRIDLFTVFSTFDMDKLGNIRRHHWKEHFNISKIAQFEIDTC